jgi:nucleotide-binding universal stress UspA family protein
VLTRRREVSVADRAPALTGGRPVMLATIEVPFEDEAIRVAVDSAVESGQPLVCVNVREIPLGWMVTQGYGDVDDPEADARALRAPAELAAALGVRVERLRVKTPHPVDALCETVAEREPGLLVFGPDRSRLRGRRYRKAVQAIRRRVACLVWLPD